MKESVQNLKELKELLVVVDMVNGFVKKGSLADPYIEHIIPEQIRLIEEFLKAKQGVLFIKDAHTKDSKEFDSFPPHCIKGTEEAELVDELKPYEQVAMSIEKNSTSAIFATGFMELIRGMENLKRVVTVGCEADICVPNLAIPLQNYFNEVNRDTQVIVPLNAIETFDGPGHDRKEYFEIGTKMMAGSGVQLVKKYMPEKESDNHE